MKGLTSYESTELVAVPMLFCLKYGFEKDSPKQLDELFDDPWRKLMDELFYHLAHPRPELVRLFEALETQGRLPRRQRAKPKSAKPSRQVGPHAARLHSRPTSRLQ